MQIIVVMLCTPLREYSNDMLIQLFPFTVVNTLVFVLFMTFYKTAKHCDWKFTVGETKTKLTIHDHAITGECVQLMHKSSLGLLVNCLHLHLWDQ